VLICVPPPQLLKIAFRKVMVMDKVMGSSGLPSLLALAGLIGFVMLRFVFGVFA
jgi:hypothetical protein